MLGNPDHAVRRLIATYQVGDFWEVAKIAFGHEGISMLRQEADLLATLHSQLSRAPRLIGFHQSKDLAVMRMSSVEGQPLAAGEVEGVVELLDDWLSRSNAVPLPKFSEWSAICSALEECQGGSEVVRALAGCQVRSALCHGDFARWNLIRSSCGRLAVIDWEWGATDGMGGLDLVHFVCQESLLIDRLRPAEAVAEIVRQLNSPKMHAHLCRTGWGSNLLLPLIACLAFKKGAGHQNQAAVLTFAIDEFLLTR